MPDNEIDDAPKPKRLGFNGLTPREWTQLSRNVWDDVSSPRLKRHLEHGAVYPLKLADRCIRMYSAPDDLVFDPFAGVGSTLVAARAAGRRSAGIELNPAFVKMAASWIDEERGLFADPDLEPRLIQDDCRNLTAHLDPESVQLTATSPPYADFIRRSVADRKKTHKSSRIVHDNNSRVKAYSDDSRDLGNLAYPAFLDDCRHILSDLITVTRPGGYAVWVVKDYRLPPDQPYVSMHSDLAAVAQEAGWRWHDLIVWNQNEQRRLVLLGFPSKFYTNQNCSFLVVLRRDS